MNIELVLAADGSGSIDDEKLALLAVEVARVVAARRRRLPRPSFGRKLFIDAQASISQPSTSRLG